MDLFPGRSEPPAADEAADGVPASDRPLTVSRLNERIQSVLKRGMGGPVRVKGEIGNLTRRQHWYFTLKDPGASIGCVAFRMQAARFDATLADGDEVIVQGEVDHWPKAGRTQLLVSSITRAGLGTLQQQLEALRRELAGEGWFDESRKKPLPRMPRRIGLITSGTGAAVHDVRKTVEHRLPAVGIVLADVAVQGEKAVPEIVAAIGRLERLAPLHGIDAIIVTRGGGSLEDLWAFNDRRVAEAIHACSLPVVAAIGHETDTTIAELVADRRASTPTQAAMVLVPDREELVQQLDALDARLRFGLRRRLERDRQRVAAMASRPVMRNPAVIAAAARARADRLAERRAAAVRQRLAAARLRLERLEGRWRQSRPAARQAARREHVSLLAARLQSAMRRRLDLASASVPPPRHLALSMRHRIAAVRGRLERQARGVALLDPTAILSRGYTYTTRADGGGLVHGPADAPAGAVILTHARDGVVRSRVESDGSPPTPASSPAPAKRPRAPRAASPPEPDAGGLFG